MISGGADIRLGEALYDWIAPYPFIWTKVFSEGSITEYIQWTFLGSAAILSIVRLSQAKRIGEPRFWMWGVLYLGLCIMLVEDAYNIRHTYADVM